MKNGFRRGDNAPMAIIEFVKVNNEVKVPADNIKSEDIVKEVSQEKEEEQS